MKTISIQQPWASLLAERVKTVELRGWKTNYRGQLLIRASRNCPVRWEDDNGKRVKLPTECLLWVGELVDVHPMQPQESVGAMSIYSNDEFSWIINFQYHVKPFPAAGKLKLYDTPDTLIERLPDAEIRTYHPELKHRTRHPFIASVVKGQLMVIDTRTGEQTYYTTHLNQTPPLAWVFVPLFAYIGGLQGGSTPINWKEVAEVINNGQCYQCVKDLPQRGASAL